MVEIFLCIISFGIWPALPLTGYWVFVLFHRNGEKNLFGPAIRFCLYTVLGLAVWSVPMLLIAMVGLFRPEIFGILGWLITIFSLRRLDQHKLKQPLFLSGRKFTPWEWVLVIGLIAAAVLYLGFPRECLMGGWDWGVYANHGIYIAHHGRMDVPYPYPLEMDSLFRTMLPQTGPTSFFPGLYPTKSTLTVQFAHLFPVWLAQAYSSTGYQGMIRLNGVFALLSLVVFFGFCRFVLPKPIAVVATLFLAFNPSEIWLARITMTEILTQLFVFAGILFFCTAYRHNSKILSRLAGILFGLSALVRIDTLFLIPLLFLSNLFSNIIEDETKKNKSHLWIALYQTALPLFMLSVVYYAIDSSPYLTTLISQVKNIGIMSIASLILLVVGSTKMTHAVNSWISKRRVLIIISSALIAMAIYAYFIRPVMPNYSLITSIESTLEGSRDFREDSLVNLAQYISPLVILGAIIGFISTLWLIFRKNQDHSLLVLPFIICGGFSLLYLWNPSIAPVHFWAIRRFVPIIIPGFILFAGIGILWILSKLKMVAMIITAFLLISFLYIFTVIIDLKLLTFTENKGYFNQVMNFASLIPNNELILSHDGTKWAEWETPLFLSFDRKIVPIDLGSSEGINVIKTWITKRSSEGLPAYLLYEGPSRLKGFDASQTGEVVLSTSFFESSQSPIPQNIIDQKRIIKIYRVAGIDIPSSYKNLNLGSEMVFGVRESGFYDQEYHGTSPFRWTNGAAVLNVPIAEEFIPRVLRLDLESTRPNGTKLRVLLNGTMLFNEHIPTGSFVKTLHVPDSTACGQAVIQLLSDTFIPKDILKNSMDNRTLGVAIRGVRLLDNDSSLLGKPLPISGYHSRLNLVDSTDLQKVLLGQLPPLQVNIRNISNDPWPSSEELNSDKGCIRVGIIWFASGDSIHRLSEQRTELPYSLYPHDNAQVSVLLNPIDYNGKPLTPGAYEVWISLVQEGITWFYDKGDELLKLKVNVIANPS